MFVGLGLLFLLVKRTETGDVVVAEDRSGVKVRLTGALQPAVINALRQALGATSQSVVAATATSFQPAVVAPAAVAPAAVAPAFVPQQVVPQQVVPQQVAAVAPVVPSVRAVDPMLVFADGRSIGVSVGGVIGRDPGADPALPGAQLYPIADPSLSKTHLSFGPLPHGVWVLDHHSTNGTVVSANGVVVPCTPGERVEAPFGARIMAGDVSMVVGSR